MLFNVFVFGVVTAFQNLGEGMGIGFGLLAELSLITLRSKVLTKTDITYFFRSLAIALINALSLPPVELVIALNTFAILAAWIVVHPKLLRDFQNAKIVLNQSEAAVEYLSEKLSVKVISYRVINIDEVNDTARLDIAYKKISNKAKLSSTQDSEKEISFITLNQDKSISDR